MTQDEYDRIKFLMKKRSHPVKKDKTLQNPLAGLIVCGFCNHKMARRPYKNGRVETILCTTSRCKNVASDIHVVEQRIIDTLKDTLKNYTNYVILFLLIKLTMIIKNYNLKNVIKSLKN